MLDNELASGTLRRKALSGGGKSSIQRQSMRNTTIFIVAITNHVVPKNQKPVPAVLGWKRFYRLMKLIDSFNAPLMLAFN